MDMLYRVSVFWVGREELRVSGFKGRVFLFTRGFLHWLVLANEVETYVFRYEQELKSSRHCYVVSSLI